MTSEESAQPSEEQVRQLGRLLNAMGRLAEGRGNMPFSLGMLFLAVSMKPGLQIKDYAKMMGLMPSHVSRHLMTLGPKERNGEEGMGLIETRSADVRAADTRAKTVVLTHKGTNLMEAVLSALHPKKVH